MQDGKPNIKNCGQTHNIIVRRAGSYRTHKIKIIQPSIMGYGGIPEELRRSKGQGREDFMSTTA